MDRNVIVIVGAHNSGKTTFIEKVVSILSEEGVKVAYIKHDPKGKAKTNTEGKDSYKIYNAGATEVIIASKKDFNVSLSPSAKTSTVPSGRFLTKPFTPNSSAFFFTNFLKPTP